MTAAKEPPRAPVLHPSLGDFSTDETSSASVARVDSWRQERRARATCAAPPGYRQGGPWGSKS